MFLRVRACHPLREAFPDFFHFKHFSDVAVLLPHVRLNGHGLGSSAFARHYLRNHFCFLLLGVLRCFSSPRSPHPLGMVPAPLLVGFPIRKSPDQVVFADPRGLSQLITSFFASMSQGIHPSPFSRFSFTLGI